MSRIFFVLLSSFTALVMGLASLFQPNSPNSPTNPTQTAVIDFEGLAEGTIVSSVSYGAGISGDNLGGYVGVFAENPNFPGQNAAMIFDSTCPPENTPAGCSGQDSDLFFPALGNILIISEDLDSSDPDDADLPDAYYDFDFSTWGAGVVTIDSIVVGDVEDVEDPGLIISSCTPGD